MIDFEKPLRDIQNDAAEAKVENEELRKVIALLCMKLGSGGGSVELGYDLIESMDKVQVEIEHQPSNSTSTGGLSGRGLMAESDFTAKIANLMEVCGFEVWPINQTRGKPKFYMKKGVADIVGFGHGVTLWVETKVDSNTQSDAQKKFEKAVVKNGGLYWLIRDKEVFLVLGKTMGWWR